MTANTALRHPHAPRALALVFMTALVVGFLPTLLSLHRRWSNFDEAYSHGYLLLALAGWLFWQHTPGHRGGSQQRRQHLAPALLQSLCIAAMAAASLAWLLFYLSGVTALQQLLLPMLVLCSAGAIGGAAMLRRALVPCTVIYLAIPIWDELLTRPLQALSTAVAGWTIRHVFGIAVSIDGFHIRIPAGTFEIQGGCSGLVFLLTALTLGIAYGQLFLHSWRGRLVCLPVAAAIGIIVNWIRIISLILIGHYSAMRSSLIGEGHLMFGFYIFGAVSLVAIFVATRMAPPAPASARTRNDVRAAPPLRVVALALVALTLGPLTLLLLRASEPATAPLVAPATIGSSLVRTSVAAWQPEFPGALTNAGYQSAQNPAITVNIVHYANPFGSGKLVSQGNHPLPVSWKMQQREPVRLENGTEILESHAIDDGGRALLVWSWYQVGNDIVATESAARLAQIRNALRLRLDGSFISMSTYCIFPDCALSQGTLRRHAALILADTSAWASAAGGRNQ